MSLLVFAGASQFIAIQLIGQGATIWVIGITTLIVNIRHILMSFSMLRFLKDCHCRDCLSLPTESLMNPLFFLPGCWKRSRLRKKGAKSLWVSTSERIVPGLFFPLLAPGWGVACRLVFPDLTLLFWPCLLF